MSRVTRIRMFQRRWWLRFFVPALIGACAVLATSRGYQPSTFMSGDKYHTSLQGWPLGWLETTQLNIPMHPLAPPPKKSVLWEMLILDWLFFLALPLFVCGLIHHFWCEGRRQRNECENCGYSLKGLLVNRCPECGKTFVPLNIEEQEFGAGTSVRPEWENRASSDE